MSTQATDPTHEVGIGLGQHRVTPKLDTIPLELQAMIIGSLESQHFRQAMKYRLVCRRLKEATDLAFRKRFVTWIHFATLLNDFDALRDGDLVFIAPRREDLSLEINMYFSSFSEDNAEAIFSFPHRTNLSLGINNGTLTGDICIRFGGFRFWPFVPMCKLLWQRTMQIYLARVREYEYPRPCIIHSALIFDFPYMDGVKFDDEKLELTVPWIKLISCLISREARFAETLRLMSSRDLEATRWKISNPIVEQGLRTALRSDIVRRVRFETCFETAGYRFMRDWPDESNCQMSPSGEYSPGYLEWFFEWAEYVGIKLATC
ncbi:hypothetical protein F4811DRAFT_501706 [Daldinia bambusicola]|nr:hypothetical protein F4811DRAFT_501706 [Daldinia bambusicola]